MDVEQDVEHDPDVRIEREGGAVRHVLHLARPFTHGAARSPAHLAMLYLHTHAHLFGLDRASLTPAEGMPPLPPAAVRARRLYAVPLLRRLLWSRLTGHLRVGARTGIVTVRRDQSVAVVFPQVQRVHVGWTSALDVPVWRSGIHLTVGLRPLRVTAVHASLRRDLPRAIQLPRFPTTARDAARRLGVPAATVVGLFIDERPPAPGDRSRALPFVPVLVYNRTDSPRAAELNGGRKLPYRESLDLISRTVVRRAVLAASQVCGKVFHVDPRSQTAGLEPGPYRPAADLDPHRVDRPLWNLDPPAAGSEQELRGPRVFVAQDNPLGIAPAKRPLGASFDYASRSNHFAAVSAYHHADAAFRMVEALGFSLAEWFAANEEAKQFPIRVVHRAPISPGPSIFDGRTVNAQVIGDEKPNVVGEVRFALADLSDTVTAPLGIAADARFAWHEFGHVLLLAATGTLEFDFAHSPGDALAAIICDLDSRIGQLAPPWRGVTFPWVEALRRHDRAAEAGWAWHGSLYGPTRDMRDPEGYRGEQILSSTLFRLYQALGGDAVLANTTTPDLATRRAAAAYTVYLVLGAIKAQGPVGFGAPGEAPADEAADVVPAPLTDAYALVTAMMAADLDTETLSPDDSLFPPFQMPTWRGGAVHKVVRWAFERQGLWAPGKGSQVWNAPGNPEAVDVYIDDGRCGHYDYTAGWHARAPHLRLAAVPAPGAPEPPDPPGTTAPRYVFVRVSNRGTQHARNPRVRVFAARRPAGALEWRMPPAGADTWVELSPVGGLSVALVPSGGARDVGPFTWSPAEAGLHGLLALVDVAGDLCNALVPGYACAVGPTRLAQMVPFDNNIAYREVDVSS